MANSQDGNKNILCAVWIFERPAVAPLALIFASSIGENTSRRGTISLFVPRFASMILIESVLKNQTQFLFCPIRIEMVFGPI